MEKYEKYKKCDTERTTQQVNIMKQKLNQYGISDPTMLDEVGLY